MKPDIRAVAIDETRHWNMERLPEPRPARIISTYVYDANQATHLCELTPSHWLAQVENHPEFDSDVELTEEQSEEWFDIMLQNLDEDGGIYMHCRDVAKLKELTRFESSKDDDATSEEVLEEAREYYQGNQP